MNTFHIVSSLLAFSVALGLPAFLNAQSVAVLGHDTAHVVLAEKSPGAGDGLRSDPGTIGKFFATNDRPYNPVVTAGMPGSWSQAQVWVRQRGGPFQLKGKGGATEIQWQWEIPATWTWISYGTHTRENLGESFLFIRSDKLAPDGGIDVIILLRDEAVPTAAELDLLARQVVSEAEAR